MTKAEAEVIKSMIRMLPVYDADRLDEKLNFRKLDMYQLDELARALDEMALESGANCASA